MRKELALHEIEQDDVVRSTKVCWNGCPECIERIDVVQGGFTGMDFLDKAVMDEWFRSRRMLRKRAPSCQRMGSSTVPVASGWGDSPLVLEQPAPESRSIIDASMEHHVDVDRSNFSDQ